LRSHNPTWLKVATASRKRVDVSLSDLIDVFTMESRLMLSAVDSDHAMAESARNHRSCHLGIASSDSLPLEDHTVDVVVASPPYCTRIDYAIATRIELAVLGIGRNRQMRSLRDTMTGTSTIRPEVPSRKPEWGATCQRLLKAVSEHESKASQSYYVKTLLQYFHDIYQSLGEIDRCLRDRRHCILVVQDSYYKDVEVRLAEILREMGASLGWRLDQRSVFHVSRNMLGVNTRSQQYRTDSTSTENVLCFTT
jgi:hypothetical protein